MKVILYSDGHHAATPALAALAPFCTSPTQTGNAYARTIARVYLYHQQPHGASGGYHWAGSTQTSLHG